MTELLDGFLHLVHLTGLSVYDVSNTFFNVLLLSVGVEVTGDRVQKFESFLTSVAEFSFHTEHIEEFGTGFSNLSGKLSCSLEIVKLGRSVEVHHLGVTFFVVINVS